MKPEDFSFLVKLLKEQSAIHLDETKQYLLESRLGPVARRHGLDSIDPLIRRLRESPSQALLIELVEAMVTTETSFFRDVHPFETLRKTVLPQLIQARSATRRLDIWCAASSSGQEPYSLAMLLRENFPELRNWNIQLLATDISREMLDRCRAGRYSQIEVNRGLPTPLLLKYFRQEGLSWHLEDSIKSMVTFRQMNLAEPWAALPRMDLILMRNVMIYFEVETKKAILERVRRLLRPDGYLILGGAETTLNLDSSFKRADHLKGGFYQHDSQPERALP